MNEEEKRDLSNCVQIAVSQYVEESGECIKDFASWFEDINAISQSQRKKIQRDVKEGFYKKAARLLTESVFHDEGWHIVLGNSVAEEEFPGNQHLKSLFRMLLDGKPVQQHISSLIHSWAELLDVKELCLKNIGEIWSSEKSDLSSDWPLTFIVKCQQEYEREKVEEFLEKMKLLMSNIKQEKEQNGKMNPGKQVNNGSGDKNPPKEPQSETQTSTASSSTLTDTEETQEQTLVKSDRENMEVDHNDNIQQEQHQSDHKEESDIVSSDVKEKHHETSGTSENENMKVDSNENLSQQQTSNMKSTEANILIDTNEKQKHGTLTSDQKEMDSDHNQNDSERESRDKKNSKESDIVSSDVKEKHHETSVTSKNEKNVEVDSNANISHQQASNMKSTEVKILIDTNEKQKHGTLTSDQKEMDIDHNQNDSEMESRNKKNSKVDEAGKREHTLDNGDQKNPRVKDKERINMESTQEKGIASINRNEDAGGSCQGKRDIDQNQNGSMSQSFVKKDSKSN